MKNNSDHKQPVTSKRGSKTSAEGRPKAGIGNLPGLTVADTFGLVACLAILSNRVSPSQALDIQDKEVKLPKLTKDLAKEILTPVAGMSAETLYLSGLVTNVRSFLLNPQNKDEVKQQLISKKSKVNLNESENGSWSLDLNNIDGSITDYLSQASIATSESQIELEIDVEDTYQDALQRMQNAADKFLEKMQQLFAEELEILIAKRGEEKQIDLPQTNEEIVLAEAEEGGFNSYGLLGLLGFGGGGGGGGGLLSAIGSGAASRLISGIGIDGYVSGATVWWDANSDGVLNDGEVYSTTNNDGTFELDGVGSTGQIVIDGGVDIETGAEVDTMVISLSDVTDTAEVTVTPLTLLSAYGVDAGAILSALGVTGDITLDSYDPVAAIEEATGDTVTAGRVLLQAQQIFAVVNSMVALAEEQGMDTATAIETVIEAISGISDLSDLIGASGGDSAVFTALLTELFPDYGTTTVANPDGGADITLAEYAASNIVTVNSLIGEYIPDTDSTAVFELTDDAKAAALISQDDLVSNFRTIGRLDPTVNSSDIASALNQYRDAASVKSNFLDVYKQNIQQQAASGGGMITGVDNVSIIASNTPTEILSSTILGNDKNLGTGELKLIAVEPLFAPSDYTSLSATQVTTNTVQEIDTDGNPAVDLDGNPINRDETTYFFDKSSLPDNLNGFVKVTIDHFTVVFQRTDTSLDMVDNLKQALASAHPLAPSLYVIESNPDNSDQFYIKRQDGLKINNDEDAGTHGPSIKAAGPYSLSDGSDLILNINSNGNLQITGSSDAIEELRINYIAANDNNQGHGVIKLSMEPSFQELAVSASAVTSVDEDNTLSIAGQTDYTATTSSAISERFFVKLSGTELTGFKLNDVDSSGNAIITDLVVSSSGNFKYPYVQVLDLSSAYISAPTNFNGNVNLSYKLISTAGNGRFSNVSEITDQAINILPVSESGSDAGTIVISDTIDAVATTLESGILSVVENLENAKTKFFSINGGDLSETRTIQLSNLPDGISVYIDGKLTTVSGGKVSFVIDGTTSKSVAFTGTEALIQSQFGLFEDTKAVIISQADGATASTGTTVSFSLDIGGAYGLDVAKSVVADPIEGDTVALGMQVNSIGENADLQVIIDITSDSFSDIQGSLELGTVSAGTFSSITSLITELQNLADPVTLTHSSQDITVEGVSAKRFTLDVSLGTVTDPTEALNKINSLVINPGDGNFKSNLDVSINVRALDSNDIELASLSTPINFSHDYQPEADGVSFSIPAEDLDFTSGIEDQALSLQKLFDGNVTKFDADEIVYFRLYDLTSLGLSVVDASGAGLGRVIDSAGTIELSQSDALNAFVSLKGDADLPTSSFYVKAFSREPTGEVSELVPATTGEFSASVKITADADAPILSMDAKVRGLVNDSVPDEFADKAFVKIPATAALEDTDGSESLYIKVTAPQTDGNGSSGSVYDFAYLINGNSYFSEETGVTNSSLTTDGNYQYGNDIVFHNDGTNNFFIIKASDLSNLQISRPASDGAFDDDFTVEAVSVDRGFETANTPFTTELTVINAAKVINGDDTSMDFATDGASKSLNVEFLQPATKPEATPQLGIQRDLEQQDQSLTKCRRRRSPAPGRPRSAPSWST